MKTCIVTRPDGRITAIVPVDGMKVEGKDPPAAASIVPMKDQLVQLVTLPRELAEMPLPVLASSYLVKGEKLVPLPDADLSKQQRPGRRK